MSDLRADLPQTAAGDPPAMQTSTSRLVISIHGIRTRAIWMGELTPVLNNNGFRHVPLNYGFFRAFKLLLPFARDRHVKWFRDKYTAIVNEHHCKRPSVVAHSFGTYLVAHAMELYGLEFDQIIFCGSIVPTGFAWSRLVAAGQVGRVLNNCAGRDTWVKIAAHVVKDAGDSGVRGFSDTACGRVHEQKNRHFRHSDYLHRWAYQTKWIPFLTGEILAGLDDRARPSNEVGSGIPCRNWKFLITKAVILALALAALVGWRFWRRPPPSSVRVVVSCESGGRDGLSWRTPYCTLQDALAEATRARGTITQIWVAQGTYCPDEAYDKPKDAGDRHATFTLQRNLAIYGGFAGNETSPEGRPVDRTTGRLLHASILSGDLNAGSGEPLTHSYHVVTGSGVDISGILDGFTIRGGCANGRQGGTVLDRGGGMLNEKGSPTVRNCIFISNFSLSGGAGMSNSDGSRPMVTDCVFIQNRSNDDGAGMLNRESSPTVTRCRFEQNEGDIADLNNGGGAMANENHSDSTVRACTFWKNSAAHTRGGGMFNADSKPTITDCRFFFNTAAINGGAIFNRSSATSIVNCLFSGNIAESAGGAMYITMAGPTTMTGCTLSANKSYNGAGGIQNANSSLTLRNCILWGNLNTHLPDAGTGGRTADQITVDDGANVTVNFSDVQGGWPDGTGNINITPLFKDADGKDNIIGTEDDDLRTVEPGCEVMGAVLVSP